MDCFHTFFFFLLAVTVFAPYTPGYFLPLWKVSFSMLEIMSHRLIDLRRLRRAALWARQPDPWGNGFGMVSQAGGFSAGAIQPKQQKAFLWSLAEAESCCGCRRFDALCAEEVGGCVHQFCLRLWLVCS